MRIAITPLTKLGAGVHHAAHGMPFFGTAFIREAMVRANGKFQGIACRAKRAFEWCAYSAVNSAVDGTFSRVVPSGGKVTLSVTVVDKTEQLCAQPFVANRIRNRRG